jgi:hypothetical protein
VGNKRFLTFHSLPIKRRNKRLGTAYAIHDLSADSRFWKRLTTNYDFRLCIWNQGRPVDLKRKKHVGLPGFISPPLPIEKAAPELNKITDKSILTLKDFPRLVYVTSSAPLHEKNTSLILILSGLFAVIIFLTFWVSLVIARKVSSPLADMAEQAQAIAQEPSHNFLDEKNIRYNWMKKTSATRSSENWPGPSTTFWPVCCRPRMNCKPRPRRKSRPRRNAIREWWKPVRPGYSPWMSREKSFLPTPPWRT